jgi:hypothetical protein
MMRKFFIFCLILTTIAVQAVGPKIPYILTWTPSPSPDVTGYYFYWRGTNEVYSDARRLAVSTNSYTGYDLRVLGLPKTVYVVMMTATNLALAESDPSADFVWNYTNPSRVTSVSVR